MLLLLLASCARGKPVPEPGSAAGCPRVFLGVEGVYSPPVLTWPPGKEPVGFEPELVKALVGELGCPLHLVGQQRTESPMELRFLLLEEGAAELSIYAFSVSPEREARVDFTRPYAADGVGLLVAESKGWSRRADLPEAPVILGAEGTTGARWVARALPRAQLRTEPTVLGEVESCLLDGPCDALVGDLSSLRQLARERPGLRVLDDAPYTREPWAIAVAEGNTTLRVALDDTLAQLEADETLPRLRERWGVQAP